jgi:hypothetical protein
MAEIVTLNKWRAQHGQKPQIRPQIRIGETDPGEVVLFTGVRYERFDDRKAENHAVRAE